MRKVPLRVFSYLYIKDDIFFLQFWKMCGRIYKFHTVTDDDVSDVLHNGCPDLPGIRLHGKTGVWDDRSYEDQWREDSD